MGISELDVVLLLTIADTCMWIVTAWRVSVLARIAAPVLQAGLGMIQALGGRLPDVPQGALGMPTGRTSLAPHRHGAQPDGGRCFTDKKGRHVVFAGKAAVEASETTANLSNTGGPAGGIGGRAIPPAGGVDLNALARENGYEPEQVAAIIAPYLGMLGRGQGGPPGSSEEGPSGPIGAGPAGGPAGAAPDLMSAVPSLLQAVQSGQLSKEQAALAGLQMLIAGRKKDGEGGAGASAGGEYW